MGISSLERTEHEGPLAPTRTVSRWWYLVLAGGVLGIVSTIWQTVERIAYAAGSDSSVCDISAVLSCSNVYSHWQSSALGVPNSLIGLPVFAFVASLAVSGLLGSQLSRPALGVGWGLTLFMTGFIVWYLEQTAFDIGALCLFCTACMVNITLVGVGLTRVVDTEKVLGGGPAGQRLRTMVDSWADLALWAGLLMAVAAMLFVGLVL
jgi:uncharacterized membrane protein